MRGLLASLAFAGSLVTAPAAAAQTTSAPLTYLASLSGDYFPLRSEALGVYHIYVRYPEGYAEAPDRRYPIVYLLDGDAAFPYLAPHHLFLTYDDKLPEAIIVGIAYGSFAQPANRRGPDFGENAAAFHAFLKTGILPAVESRVRGDPARRVLVGQSRGGGFVLYSAYTDPDLFWARIVSNPTLQTHRKLLLESSPPRGGAAAKLFVASGTQDRPPIRAQALEWFEAHARKPGQWEFRRLELEGGTHAADLPNVYRRGMKWLFGLGD